MTFQTTLDGAMAEKMRITSGGNVGIGTTNPSTGMEIAKTSSYFWTPGTNNWNGTLVPPPALTITNSSYSGYDPVLIFRQATSEGTAKPSGAIGMLGESSWNDASLATQISSMYFITRDASGNLQERMRITSSGNVGIGTTNPSSNTLQVTGSAGKTVGGTTWADLSDSRLKNVQGELNGSALDTLMQLRPISFKWNETHQQLYGGSTDNLMYGFVAQEIMQVIPEFVKTGGDGYYWYNPSGFEAILTAAVQELNASTSPLYYGISVDSGLATSTPFMSVDSFGNVSIGTTSATSKLNIGGDVAAEGFVNISTREAKENIEYLNENDYDEALADILGARVATYNYVNDPAYAEASAGRQTSMTNGQCGQSGEIVSPAGDTISKNCGRRLGLIAEEAPKEVLSADHKGVDLYKMVSFAWAGMKAQQKEIEALRLNVDDLRARIGAISNGQAGEIVSPAGDTISFGWILNAFRSLGAIFENGVARFQSLIAGSVNIEKSSVAEANSMGETTIPAGQTFVVVPNKIIRSDSQVFFSLKTPLKQTLAVTEIQDGTSFKIEMAEPETKDVKVGWLIVGAASSQDSASSPNQGQNLPATNFTEQNLGGQAATSSPTSGAEATETTVISESQSSVSAPVPVEAESQTNLQEAIAPAETLAAAETTQ
jgi:hypothetical protein